MPASHVRCPEDAELRAFHHGDSDEDDLERIAGHLERCAACSEKLARIEEEIDPVLAALRHRRLAGVPEEAATTEREAVAQRPGKPWSAPGYEVLEWLGSGGMSEVVKARHLRLGRLVALKRLRTDSLFDLGRFRREAEAVALLQHPNVIQIFEFGEHDGQPFLAMEYANGGSLSGFLRGRPQPPRDAATLVEALAAAVEHAHRRGVIHRDLKPANILLQGAGDPAPAEPGGSGDPPLSGFVAKVGDFGIARRIQDPGGHAAGGVTRTGAILGTPSYMAPEQAAGRKAGPPADIYALGAILYELLVGRPPFHGEETFETLRQVIHDDPVPPARLRPGLPRDLETICLKCLYKDPARRYTSAAELGADLHRYREGMAILARPSSTLEAAWKWAKRHPATASAITVAQASLIILVVSASWYSGRLRQALVSTRSAEQQSEQNARLALEAHKQLVGQVQTLLKEAPTTRALRTSLLETAASGLQRVASTDPTAPRLSQAMAQELLGEVHWELGHGEEAIAALENCVRISDGLLAVRPSLAEALEIRSRAGLRLGSIHLQQDKPEVARADMARALAAAESWRAASPGDVRSLAAVINATINLGHAAQWVRDDSAARDALVRGRDLCERWLISEPGDRRAIELLGNALDLLAGMDESRGDTPAALASYRRSLELALELERLAASRDEAASPQALVRAIRQTLVSQNNLGMALIRTRDLAAARVQMDGSVTRARRLATRDPEDLQRQLDLVDALYGRAQVDLYDLRHANAVAFLVECQSLLAGLDSRGKLSGRPIYGLERREEVDRELTLCRLLPAALADESALWSAPDAVVLPLARARVEILLRDRRTDDAVRTAGKLLVREPGSPRGWFELARTCSLLADRFAREPSGAGIREIHEKLIDRGVASLRQFLTRRTDHPDDAWQADENLVALRGHPGFAALQSLRAARDTASER